MKDFFTKTLDEIDENDINELIDTPEGQLFEIKEGLSAENNHTDPWYNKPSPGKPRKGPGDYAKQNIFKELVAFSNSEGGWLVLGLKETDEQPKRVKSVASIADCHELSSRFERAAHDWIDPPLLSLTCIGVQIGDVPNEGVVVFRVSRSIDAPHRLYKSRRTQEAYRRVGDESKPMKMREIQDLALETYRGHERLNREFEISKRRYMELKPERSPKVGMIGFRITLVPLTPLTIDRPYLHSNLFKRKSQIKGSFPNSRSLVLETMDDMHSTRTVGTIRPILRGANRRWASKYDVENGAPNEDIAIIEVMVNGTVNVIVKSTFTNPVGAPTRCGVSIRWILSDLANALTVAGQSRRIGGNPSAEYALELELRYDLYKDISGINSSLDVFSFGLLEEDGRYSQKIGPDSLLLPRYRVGSENEFPQLIKIIMDDLYNAVGKPHLDDFNIEPID